MEISEWSYYEDKLVKGKLIIIKKQNEQQFIEVTTWQKETFKKSDAISKIHHLKEEVNELLLDVSEKSKERRLEFADCFLLLYGAAYSDGMSYEDISKCIDEKLKICKERKWGIPDENGIVKHLK